MLRAAERLITHLEKTYHRVELPEQKMLDIQVTGSESPAGIPVIVPIGSASSEHEKLNGDAFHVLKWAAAARAPR